MPDLVNKSTYAAMCNRSPAAVTHWIAERKLTAPALVRQEDGSELIDPDLADAQLRETLHPSQQMAQERPVGYADKTTALGAVAETGEASAPLPKPATSDLVDDDQRRYNKARADRMEREAEELRRKQLADAGKWMETPAARAAWAKEGAAIINEVEAWLGQVSKQLAVELQVEPKPIAVILRQEFRAFRARQAEAKRGEAAGLQMAAE